MSAPLAIGALRAAEHLVAVPEDLSIVGFDDIPLASQIQPALTTIGQLLIEKDMLAVELLFNDTKSEVSRILPTKLIVRESSGIAPSKH